MNTRPQSGGCKVGTCSRLATDTAIIYGPVSGADLTVPACGPCARWLRGEGPAPDWPERPPLGPAGVEQVLQATPENLPLDPTPCPSSLRGAPDGPLQRAHPPQGRWADLPS